MIIDCKKRKGIMVYYVGKDFPDEELPFLLDKKLVKGGIPVIIDHDADVYTTEGKLLMKFRKKVLSERYIEKFYDNVIHFAENNKTNNRGTATGSKRKTIEDNPAVLSNILGYFDKMSPTQKVMLREKGIDLPVSIRETRFTRDYPEQYAELIPFIQQIDTYSKARSNTI
jgi:hypothetical protein